MNPIVAEIKKHNKIYIVPHQNPDGDAVGAAVAVYWFLKKNKKSVHIVGLDTFPADYEFLLKDVKNDSFGAPELAIIVDCGDKERVIDKEAVFNGEIIVNVDHHISNDMYGDLNVVEPFRSSTCETLYYLLEDDTEDINMEYYKALYTGILTDTGNFAFTNTKKETFLAASNIMKFLDNPSDIHRAIYASKTINKLNLTGVVLERAEAYFNNKLVISYIKKEDYEKYDISLKDIDGVIDYLGEIKGVEVYILLKERDEDVKISLRSVGNFDLLPFATKNSGGGHKFAAGATMFDEIFVAKQKIVEYWKDILI